MQNLNKYIKKAKKLKLFPEGVYSPSIINAVWNVYISDRSSGKTTAWLIIGLIAYVTEGTVTHYIRSRDKMIRESNINKIYSVIVNCGYIEKITNNKFNSIEYVRNHRGFYLCKKDDAGNIEFMDDTLCCKVMSIDNNDSYKSSYQCDTADLVIFDEFINIYYVKGEFVTFCDLLSTLFRKRMNCYIIMLANTIQRTSEYFDELECRDFINNAEQGDISEYNVNGTTFHVEICGVKLTSERKLFNSRYFGLNNKKLASITGAGWSVDNAQHITKKPVMYHLKNRFIYYQGCYIQLNVVELNEVGICIYATKSNEPSKDDCRIYTVDSTCDFTSANYVYKFGNTKFDAFLWKYLYSANKWFFSNNDVASRVRAYIKSANQTTV